MSNQEVKIILNEDDLPKDAVRVHLYDWHNVLMPRGSRKKESIHGYLLDSLIGAFESWTDPKYGDNPDPRKLQQQLHYNLLGETAKAFDDFLEWKKRKE